MKASPSIHIDEFCYYSTAATDQDGFQTVERNHPVFGYWRQRSLDLGHIKVFQHQSDLKRPVNVQV
jgi:hypothetical protein